MDSSFEIISDEEVQDIRAALEEGDLCTATERLSESLRDIENAPLNIAITGESGTGKSTFVNAIRGMDDEEEGSAKTGVVETTGKPTPYNHPQYPNVTVWDLPGIGTPNFAADSYLQSVDFSRYDFFIILSSERFKKNDIDLAKAVQAMNKKFYFVRSKVDSDLHASQVRRKKTFNEENVLNEIRNNCIQSLRDGDITEPQVFLLSFLELDKFDFHIMQDTLEKELPEHKRHIFLISLPNISLPVLEKKRQAFKKDIWKLSLLSGGVAAVPIPGLSVACDIGILVKAMINYKNAFGLDEKSLEKLADKFGKDVNELKSVIKSPLVIKEINKELVTTLLKSGVTGGLMIVEYAASNIPMLGSMAAGGISFGTTYWMLSGFLKEIAEDANRVLMKALESPEDWCLFLALAEFAFNGWANQSTGTSPFFCNYGFHPHFGEFSRTRSGYHGVDVAVQKIGDVWREVQKNIGVAQFRQKQKAAGKRSLVQVLQVGDMVWLSSKNIKLKVPSTKLCPKCIGPYEISEVVNPVAFRLRLPQSFRIPKVFHKSLLKKCVPSALSPSSLPPPVSIDGGFEYEVQRIIGSHGVWNSLPYLVHWKGYRPEERFWVPAHLQRMMDSSINIISDEEVQHIRAALEEGDLCTTTERLIESLREIENAPLNIAITGESGTGKSTFVNAIRGMDDEEEGSAKTGVVEEPTPYGHPQYPNVTVWDLPGIGTPDFTPDNYLQSVNFSHYDFFIILSSERFKKNDIDLAKAIHAMNKKFYFVRSKVDDSLYASQVQRKKTFNKENILNEIRNNCIQSLRDGGITEPQVFLLSFLELDQYDFDEMQDTLLKELPEQKRHIFLISLPNISLPILEKKRQAFKKDIWKLSLLSCGVAMVPVPGLSIACDIGILVTAIISYKTAFGLDNKSLVKLAKRFGKDVRELRSVIKSPLVIQEVNKELVISLISKAAVACLSIIEYFVSTIPVVGTIAAGGISFGTIYWMLSSFLEEIAEDAVRVLYKTLETLD
ncbi:LOW QUALITY PROTEIN: uncharacterized protein ACNLHF_001941 [Anomaloglossus baeobatrachus]